MSVFEHYANHLGPVYSWMIGDFEEQKNQFLSMCRESHIQPLGSRVAIDLGAGNGIQSIALAELGFHVVAMDFNRQLLNEIEARKGGLQIETVKSDIRNVFEYRHRNAELIVCCGDTITLLESVQEIVELIRDIGYTLAPKGKVILSFRDYSTALYDTSRFIHVKSDSERILTCFLEYFAGAIRVTDILYERETDDWKPRISSYDKVRISQQMILEVLTENRLDVIINDRMNGMRTVIAEKQ